MRFAEIHFRKSTIGPSAERQQTLNFQLSEKKTDLRCDLFVSYIILCKRSWNTNAVLCHIIIIRRLLLLLLFI